MSLLPLTARTRTMALLSYMSVLCLIPLIFDHNEPFVRFHARQGVVLWIWSVLAMFSLHLPILGGYIFSVSALLIGALSLFGVVAVLMAKRWRLPLIDRVAGAL
ncbi:MAG: hypothetical protein HQL51_03665 [Magnetococcales bacterium]|nr:hypothetical protein [Magnetococcales bacterium]